MNKFSLYILIFSLITPLYSCQKQPKIGFILSNVTSSRWEKDRRFFTEKAEELGAIVYTEIAYDDPNTQLKLAQKLLNKEIDVLVVIPSEVNQAAVIIKEAHKYGVPVIAYDRLIRDCQLDYYISFNNVKVGELQAQYMLMAKPIGNYIIIPGAITDNNSHLIYQGYMNILATSIQSKAINILSEQYTQSWSSNESYQIINTLINENPQINIDVILSGSDGITKGIIDALKDHQLAGKVLVSGQDADLVAINNITSGYQEITIYKSIKKLAHTAAEAAYNLSLNNELPLFNKQTNNGATLVPTMLLQPQVVDASNIKLTVISDGFFSEQELQ